MNYDLRGSIFPRNQSKTSENPFAHHSIRFVQQTLIYTFDTLTSRRTNVETSKRRRYTYKSVSIFYSRVILYIFPHIPPWLTLILFRFRMLFVHLL